MTSRFRLLPAILRHPVSLVVAAFALSCIGDASGPGVARPALLQFAPYFQNEPPRGIVRVDRIRIVLTRSGETRAALDTTVQVTPGDSVLDLRLTVPVYTAADTFSASMDMLDAQGTVVFHGGPITVVAIATQRSDTPPPVTPLEIRYVGVGADAASVEITPTVVPGVLTGDTTVLTAVARKADGTEIPGTPVGWTSLDTATARVPDLTQGRVVGRLQRGSARVVAQLVTGQADTVLVPVKLLPSTISIVAGAGQSGVVGSLLPQQVVARAVAVDEVPVSGVWIKFQITAGGGTVSRDSGLTDATGQAGVGWTLGTAAGGQTMVVTTPKVAGLQATASATSLAGPATTLSLAGLTSPVVAIGATFSVKAKDQFGNTATAYRGTVHFTSTDQLAVLPADYTFTTGDAGLHTFASGVTFGTSGNQTLTATDVVTSSITGSQSISVGAAAVGAVATFAITGLPGSTVAGPGHTITVTAKDGAGNTVTTYTGTALFTSNDPLATVPTSYTFQPGDNGSHTFVFGVVFRTAGSRSITATDQATGTITGTGNITVNPTAPAAMFVTGLPSTTLAGVGHDITVSVRDTFANTVTGYAGTVHFVSSDTAATVPADYTFVPADQGAHLFSGAIVLETSGPQVVTVYDLATQTVGGGAAITVNPLSATHLVFTVQPSDVVLGGTITPPVVVSALDAYGNVATGFNGLVTLSLGATPCGVTGGGSDPAVTAAAGVAVFSDLVIDGEPICDGYTAIASADGLTSAESATFNVLAPAGVNAWISAVSGNWSDGTKWTSGAPPTAGEIATVTVAGTYTVTLDVSATIAGLTLGGSTGTQTLQISSPTLTLNGGGTVGTNGLLSQVGGTITGTGTLSVDGQYDWSAGTLAGTGTTSILATGTLSLTTAGSKYLQARTLTNAGTVIFPAPGTGSVYLWDAPIINNLAGGLIDIQSTADIPYYSGAVGTINNAGMFRKSAGAALTNVGANLNNSGAVEALSDTLQFTQGGTNTGSFTIAAAGRLDWGGGVTRTLAAGSSVTGAGHFSTTGGTTTVSGSYNITGRTSVLGGTLAFSATLPDTAKTRVLVVFGTQAGTGIVSVSDSMVWTSGTLFQAGGETHIRPGAVMLIDGASAKYLQARTLTNQGTIKFPATGTGGLNLWDAATIENLATGLIDYQADADIVYYSGASSTINNVGIIKKSGGAGVSILGDRLNHTGTGTIEVQTGTLQLPGTGTVPMSTMSAPVTVSGGSALNFNASTFELSNGFSASGAGHVDLTGGALVAVTGTDSLVFRHLAFYAGGMEGPGVFYVSDSLYWAGGEMRTAGGRTRIGPAATLLVDGASAKYLRARTLINHNIIRFPTTTGTGSLNLWDAATIENLATGLIDYQADADIVYYSGASSTINNVGIIKKSGGAGVSILGDRLNHTGTGTIEVQTGTLQLPGTGTAPVSTMSAPITISGGSALNFNASTFELSNGFSASGAGHVDLTGGALVAVTGTDSLVFRHLAFYAGGMEGPGVFYVTDSLYWAGGEMRTAGGRTRIGPVATLLVDGASAKYLRARTLINHGTVRFPATTGTGNLNLWDAPIITNLASGVIDIQTDAGIPYYSGLVATFTNQGTIQKSGGTAVSQIGANVTNQAGSITSVASGGTLSFTNALDHQDNAILQGTGTVNLSVATVTMNGDINPGIPLTAGGILSITGNLTLGSAAEINIEVSSPTVYDVLAISGVATLDGTLLIEGTYGPLAPLETLSLTAITYGSNPGPSTLASVITSLLNGSISPPPTYGSTSVTAFVLGL